MAYYNDNDEYCAAWLRNLATAGHIASGAVDARDIRLVRADNVRGHAQCHFFAGIGLWSHALRTAGWSDERPVWTASLPCQPFSVAGRQEGFADNRHLWPVFKDLVTACRPPVILGEQVASRAGREWLATVRADLEALGYAVGGADLCSAGVGAPNIRQRLYWVADATWEQHDGSRHIGAGWRCEPANGSGMGHPRQSRLERHADAERGDKRPAGLAGVACGFWSDIEWIHCLDGKSRPAQPGIFPLAARHPGDVARLRAYGNAINPVVASAFISACMECMR